MENNIHGIWFRLRFSKKYGYVCIQRKILGFWFDVWDYRRSPYMFGDALIYCPYFENRSACAADPNYYVENVRACWPGMKVKYKFPFQTDLWYNQYNKAQYWKWKK